MRIAFAALPVLAGACAEPISAAAQAGVRFAAPQPVAIAGYDGDAMEPFLSRDGATLFFNNRNDSPDRTDLHWATRVDDLHFQYRGKIEGANSGVLDGVPTLAVTGRLCFVSPRAYAQTLATVHCGQWIGDRVVGVKLQPKAAPLIPGRVVFDVELDASGEMLILADGQFTGGRAPVSADLRLARFVDGAYRLDPSADMLFAAVNTDALEYAAALSTDGLTLAFTRVEERPSILIARRPTLDVAFGPPMHINVIQGFVEAATFAPDGAIYFHKRDAGRFSLWRAAPQ